MSERNDRNQRVIAEYRERKGQPGGTLPPIPLLLLTTTGAKTGRQHVAPMGYLEEGGKLHVFASFGGGDKNPAWYHNLVKNPRVTVEAKGESYQANAVVITGAEHDRIYGLQAAKAPIFAEYQKKTSRIIPVVALERI